MLSCEPYGSVMAFLALSVGSWRWISITVDGRLSESDSGTIDDNVCFEAFRRIGRLMKGVNDFVTISFPPGPRSWIRSLLVVAFD